MIEDLVSPCGLHCGACPLHQAEQDPELARRLAGVLELEPEEVPCSGCRPTEGCPTVMKGKQCETYSCVAERGHAFCHECDSFPCLNLAPCAHRAQNLPHNTKIYNLLLIQKEGLQAWAERAAERNRQYFKGVKEDGGAPIEIPVKFEES